MSATEHFTCLGNGIKDKDLSVFITPTVSQRTDGDYDISLTPPAAERLLLASEGHTAETAVYIDGVELKGNTDDSFRAFPHRATRFIDSFWST